MFELEKSPEVQRLIQITKSDSGISGPVLAQAHIKLGQLLAAQMDFVPKDTTIVAIMRGGLFLRKGFTFNLDTNSRYMPPSTGPFNGWKRRM